MGIVRRLRKVLESNLTALVERAENPAKMLDQAIEDMKQGQKDARASIIEARTQQRLLERKRDKARGDAEAYEAKAVRALENGDEDLARRALELKLAAEQRAEAEAQAVQEQLTQIAQLEQAEQELARRLAEMPAKRAALLARQAAAQARGARTGAASKAQDSVHHALNAFDRMEEKVIRSEVEADVMGETDPDLLDPVTERKSRTDQALEALRAKVASKQLPPGASEDEDRTGSEPAVDAEFETSEVDADAVEDSLAALKHKLRSS
jgi:phage shock protein A